MDGKTLLTKYDMQEWLESRGYEIDTRFIFEADYQPVIFIVTPDQVSREHQEEFRVFLAAGVRAYFSYVP